MLFSDLSASINRKGLDAFGQRDGTNEFVQFAVGIGGRSWSGPPDPFFREDAPDLSHDCQSQSLPALATKRRRKPQSGDIGRINTYEFLDRNKNSLSETYLQPDLIYNV